MPSCTNRKKTLGEVSEYLASQGYELLSTKYSSNSAKLDIRCPAGHQYRASWNTFQKGSRCPECRGNARVQFKDIKEIARFRRYSLISTSYQNKTPIIFRCSQGHMVSQSYRGFREYGCYYCKRKPLIDQDHVIQTIQKSGYKVEIVGPLTAMGKVLEITCSSGHTYIGSWNAFKAGKRCGKCRGRNKSRTELESMASSSGLILMDSTGNRHDSKQLVQCAAKNHVYWTRTYSLAAGCKFCTKGVTTVNDLIQIAAERGDRIDLEATTIAVPAPQRAEINIDLPCGHRIRKQIRGYLKYTNCRQCNVSSGEWELNSRLSKWNPTKIRLNNKELDLYIPELNLAIEYCGLYWHSDKFLEPSYHQDKLKTCHKNGISLLTIFEDEWKKDPDKWVNFGRDL